MDERPLSLQSLRDLEDVIREKRLPAAYAHRLSEIRAQLEAATRAVLTVRDPDALREVLRAFAASPPFQAAVFGQWEMIAHLVKWIDIRDMTADLDHANWSILEELSPDLIEAARDHLDHALGLLPAVVELLESAGFDDTTAALEAITTPQFMETALRRQSVIALALLAVFVCLEGQQPQAQGIILPLCREAAVHASEHFEAIRTALGLQGESVSIGPPIPADDDLSYQMEPDLEQALWAKATPSRG